MDWSLFHAINSAVATRDSIEDPVTLLDAFAVALYAAAIVARWVVALLEHVWARLPQIPRAAPLTAVAAF